MSGRNRIIGRLLRSDRGAAALEFAIVSTVFVTVCIGIVDFGRTLYVKNQLSYLADIAARRVLLNPQIATATLETDLRSAFSGGDPGNLTISITPETVGTNDFRRIVIAFPITLFVPFIPNNNLNLTVTRRAPA